MERTEKVELARLAWEEAMQKVMREQKAWVTLRTAREMLLTSMNEAGMNVAVAHRELGALTEGHRVVFDSTYKNFVELNEIYCKAVAEEKAKKAQ